MEYRGYTPELVKKDKRKYMTFIILLILPILMGAIFLLGGVTELRQVSVEDVSEISYKSMAEGDVYYFKELVLIDSYGYYGNSMTELENADKVYYLVCFKDRDESIVYTSLQMTGSGEIAEKCKSYLKDETLMAGDVILSGCFHGYKNGSTIDNYFEDVYKHFSAEIPGEKLDWNFYYDDAQTIEEYNQKQSSMKYVWFIMSAVFVIPAIIGIKILIRKRKELDQYIEEYENNTITTEDYRMQ